MVMIPNLQEIPLKHSRILSLTGFHNGALGISMLNLHRGLLQILRRCHAESDHIIQMVGKYKVEG